MIADIAGLFIKLVQSGLLDSLPNIPTKTMGGHLFWNNLAEYNGWRLQQNMVTQHCRILDPQDYRRAWGTKNKMKELFEELDK